MTIDPTKSVWRRGYADVRKRGKLVATGELFICDHASHPGCKLPGCDKAKPHKKGVFCAGDFCDQCRELIENRCPHCGELLDTRSVLCFVKCVPYEEPTNGTQ